MKPTIWPIVLFITSLLAIIGGELCRQVLLWSEPSLTVRAAMIANPWQYVACLGTSLAGAGGIVLAFCWLDRLERGNRDDR